MRVTERSIDKKGKLLLVQDIELEGLWTNLDLPDQEIIEPYKWHVRWREKGAGAGQFWTPIMAKGGAFLHADSQI